MEEFIDSHCHLADEAFAGDRSEVIERARAAGAAGLVCIGASVEQARESARIAKAHPGFAAFTAGVHPHDASAFDPAHDLPCLEELVSQGACAIGECGLDYHYDNSPRETQRTVFAAQIDLAARHRLPVVVHTRDADSDMVAMVRQAGAAGVRGVMHCFTSSHELAETAIDAGWFISFSGIITFRNWSGDEILASIPEDRILVESDSPYLAPVPYRGKRNEPQWVTHTLQRAAAVRQVPAAELGASVTRNAKLLFSLHETQARPH